LASLNFANLNDNTELPRFPLPVQELSCCCSYGWLCLGLKYSKLATDEYLAELYYLLTVPQNCFCLEAYETIKHNSASPPTTVGVPLFKLFKNHYLFIDSSERA
jgi:hypothetical protein